MAIKTLEEFLAQVTPLELINIAKSNKNLAKDIEKYLDNYNNGELLGIREDMASLYLPSFPISDTAKEDIWKQLEENDMRKYNNLLAYYSIINSPSFNSLSLETKEKLRLSVKALILQIKRQISIYGNGNAFWNNIKERRTLTREQSTSINEYMRYKVEQKGMFLLPSEVVNGKLIYPNSEFYAPYATEEQLVEKDYDGAWQDSIVVENTFIK